MYEKIGYLKMCSENHFTHARKCCWILLLAKSKFLNNSNAFFCLIASWGWLNTAVHACTFMPSSKYCSVALRFFDKIHGM